MCDSASSWYFMDLCCSETFSCSSCRRLVLPHEQRDESPTTHDVKKYWKENLINSARNTTETWGMLRKSWARGSSSNNKKKVLNRLIFCAIKLFIFFNHLVMPGQNGRASKLLLAEGRGRKGEPCDGWTARRERFEREENWGKNDIK